MTVPVDDLYDDDDDDGDDDDDDDDDNNDDDDDNDDLATNRARSPKWLRLDQGRASEISALPFPTSTLKRKVLFRWALPKAILEFSFKKQYFLDRLSQPPPL